MIRFRDRELATIGERVAELRQKAGLTQSELAARIGVTQGYISRLETGGKLQQMNPHLLEAIIEGLEVEKGEALRGTHMERLVLDEVIDEDSGQHMHYCPNPFCSRNEIRRTPVRTYAIAWKSAERVSRPEFAQVEFCGHCGTRLVKVCPHCGKRIRKAPEYFCCRCGRQIHDRPNGPERKLLAELYGRCDESFPASLEGGDTPPPGADSADHSPPDGATENPPAAQSRENLPDLCGTAALGCAPSSHRRTAEGALDDAEGGEAGASPLPSSASSLQASTVSAVEPASTVSSAEPPPGFDGELSRTASNLPSPPGWADGQGPAPFDYVLAHLPEPQAQEVSPELREKMILAGLAVLDEKPNLKDWPLRTKAFGALQALRHRGENSPENWPGDDTSWHPESAGADDAAMGSDLIDAADGPDAAAGADLLGASDGPDAAMGSGPIGAADGPDAGPADLPASADQAEDAQPARRVRSGRSKRDRPAEIAPPAEDAPPPEWPAEPLPETPEERSVREALDDYFIYNGYLYVWRTEGRPNGPPRRRKQRAKPEDTDRWKRLLKRQSDLEQERKRQLIG